MKKQPYNLRTLFFQHVAQTSSSPLAIKVDKAEGVFLYSDGKKILDLVSGVSVSNVGHGNREVIDAVKKQAENYFHLMVYGEIIEAPQVMHAQLLTSILPKSLNSVYYLNSGTEANEAALKLAKRITHRPEMISMTQGYHGGTHGSLSMMGPEYSKTAFRPLLPGVSHVRFNSLEDLKKINENTACVLIEPVQAEAGVIAPENNYLKALRDRCTEVGAMLIFDEVQTGFGRTGEMFAMLKYNVTPDIVTFAKALGGGMPLGAMVTSKENMEAFQTNPILGHITTFGGHPVCCAAALASLKVLLREPWVKDVERKGQKFEDALKNHSLVKEIRRVGLLIAVDLGKEEYASKMIPLLLEEGVMGDYFLFNPTSFRIAPPLCINDEEIDYAINKVILCLDKLK